MQDVNQARFLKLKQICVPLLSLTNQPTSPLLSSSLNQLLVLLRSFNPSDDDRDDNLSPGKGKQKQTDNDYIPLSPSLIHYVFFPLSQILRSSSPSTSSSNEIGLPDRILELIFESLSHLAHDWWQVWAEEQDLKVPSISSGSSANGSTAAADIPPQRNGSTGLFGNMTGTSSEARDPTPFSTRFIPSQPLPDPNLRSSKRPELEDLKKKYQVWEQLLILGSISLGGSPAPSSSILKENQPDPKKQKGVKSDETRLSILKFLNQLLRPRFSQIQPQEHSQSSRNVGLETEVPEKKDEWEWDGVSDLPSLDEFDSQTSLPQKQGEGSDHKSMNSIPKSSSSHQVYPSTNHLLLARSPTSRGALAHLLTTCLNLSCGSSKVDQISASLPQSQSEWDGDGMLEMRELALSLSGRILRTWIGGVKEKESDPSWNWSLDFALVSEETQQAKLVDHLLESNHTESFSSTSPAESSNLRTFLPGFISAMIRMISSSSAGNSSYQKSDQDHPFANIQNSKSRKPASARMQSIALDQIREMLCRCLGDSVTAQEREAIVGGIGAESELQANESKEKSKFTSLEDFADLNLQDQEEQQEDHSSKEETPQDSRIQGDFKPTLKEDTDSKGTPAKDPASKAKPSFLQSSLPPLHSSLISLSRLVNHSSPRAQSSMLLLAFDLLENCQKTLESGDEMRKRSRAASQTQRFSQEQDGDGASIVSGLEGDLEQLGREKSTIDLLLGWILDLSSSSNTFSATLPVLGKFLSTRLLISSPNLEVRNSLLSRAFSLSQASLKRLPRAIQNKRGDLVIREAGRIQALLNFVISEVDSPSLQLRDARGRLSAFLSPEGQIQDWAFPLMDCLTLSLTPISFSATASQEDYPDPGDGWSRSFQNLEDDARSGDQIRQLFKEIGKSIGRLIIEQVKDSQSTRMQKPRRKQEEEEEPIERLFHPVFYFLNVSASHRSISLEKEAFNSRISLTAALFADEIIQGIATILGDAKLNFIPGREGKRLRKVSHAFGKRIQKWVSTIWEEDGVEEVQAEAREVADRFSTDSSKENESIEKARKAEEQSSIEVQHLKGTDAFPDRSGNQSQDTSLRLGGAIDLSFVRHANMSIDSSSKSRTTATSLVRQHVSALNLSTLLQLSILTSSSKLLGLKFRPFLQSLLYPLIASLASSNSPVPNAAFSSLRTIAKESGYGDLRNLIMSNSDWILGESSWRLVNGLGQALESGFNHSYSDSIETKRIQSANHQVSMAPLYMLGTGERFLPLVSALTAPLVLVQTLRLLGTEALPLVEDAIDEVLDTLDRFHGHESICEGLWNVLDGVVECMLEDKRKEETSFFPETQKDEHTETQKDEHNIHATKEREQQKSEIKTPFEHFEKWFRSRSNGRTGKGKGKGKSNEQDDPQLPSAFNDPSASSNQETSEPANPPATRSQEVLISILSKSVPFLSHSSTFLRSKVLRLLSNGIQILSNCERSGSSSNLSSGIDRSEDLLPILNRAWPLVMSRLGISPSSPIPDMSLFLDQRERKKEKERLESQISEREPVVWLEGVNLLDSISQHVNEFLGKKVTEEAWPRMQFILERIANGLNHHHHHHHHPHQRIFHGKKLTDGTGSTPRPNGNGNGTETSHSVGFFQLACHSLQAEIYISVFKCLSSNVTSQGPIFSEEISFQILINPILKICLDVRQDGRVRAEALQLLRNLAKFNPDAVWMVFQPYISRDRGDMRKMNMNGLERSGRLRWLRDGAGDGLNLVDPVGGRNEIEDILNGLYLK